MRARLAWIATLSAAGGCGGDSKPSTGISATLVVPDTGFIPSDGSAEFDVWVAYTSSYTDRVAQSTVSPGGVATFAVQPGTWDVWADYVWKDPSKAVDTAEAPDTGYTFTYMMTECDAMTTAVVTAGHLAPAVLRAECGDGGY